MSEKPRLRVLSFAGLAYISYLCKHFLIISKVRSRVLVERKSVPQLFLPHKVDTEDIRVRYLMDLASKGPCLMCTRGSDERDFV